MIFRSAALLVCLLLGVLLPPLALAQPAATPLVVDENYRLQAGDVILVTVLGEEKLGGSLGVGPGGSIALPIVGSVQVVGKTLTETRDLIARTYSDVIRRPYVSVALDEAASRRRVYVSGRVEKPGVYMLPLGATLPEAVVAAGFSEDADLSQVSLRRASGEVLTVDLTGLRTNLPLQTTVILAADDQVYVPSFDNRLTVLGQVMKPGTFTVPLGRTFRIVDVLTQIAGGFTEGADRRRALLIRAGSTEPEEIDLLKMLEAGDMRQNYALTSGDVLIVPEMGRVAVVGEVNQPVSFIPAKDMTLLEAIVRAGGFTANAGLRQAQLRRGDQVCSVDLEALWRRGDVSQNVPLEAGDVLVVPRAPQEELLVMGAVLKAGSLDIRDQENLSLLKVLANAGRTPASDFSRISIFRGDEHIVANAVAALEQGDMRHNPQLQAGDVVYVPEVGKVALLGFFGDWFIRAAINQGLPLNTVISSANLLTALGAAPEAWRERVLVSIAPDRGTKLAQALIEHVQSGGKVLLYGPLGKADPQLRDMLGLEVGEAVEGALELRVSEQMDELREGEYARQVDHDSLLTGGPLRETAVAGAEAEVLAVAAGSEAERVVAAHAAGLAWVRGADTYRYTRGGHLLAMPPANEAFPGGLLMRLALARLGYHVSAVKLHAAQSPPITCVARHSNGFFMSGYTPDTTVALRLRFPQGAPLLVGAETELSQGRAVYHLPRAWHRECRVFVAGQQDGVISCREQHSGEIGISRRLMVTGLRQATVRFYPPTGAERVTMLSNPRFPYLVGDFADPQPDPEHGGCLIAHDVSGDLLISW